MGVAVVRGRHEGDEDGAADVGVHSLLAGQLEEEVCRGAGGVGVVAAGVVRSGMVCGRGGGSGGARFAMVGRFLPPRAYDPPFPPLVAVPDVVEADAQRLAGLAGSRVQRAEGLLHADGVFGRDCGSYGTGLHAVVL